MQTHTDTLDYRPWLPITLNWPPRTIVESMAMLKVGIVGLGFISHEHARVYSNSQAARIVAVCDPNRQRAMAWIEKWRLNGVAWHPALDSMLDSDSFDIVEILTPHYLHCEHVVKCADARVRGISVQKPMAVGLAECDQMIAACRNSAVVLRVFENYIFYPIFKRAKELIEDGLIGRPMSIRIHTMAGKRKDAPWPHFWDPQGDHTRLDQTGTSPLIGDDGLHKFQLASWLLDKPIQRIGAWIDCDTPLDAPAFLRLKFEAEPNESAQYGQLDFNFSSEFDISSDIWLDDFVEVFGEQGVMWINQCAAAGQRELFPANEMSASGRFPPIVVFRGGKVKTYLDGLTPEERNWSTSFMACSQHFIDVMQHGGEPICTGEQGKQLNRYAIAALYSAQEGRDVDMSEITTESEISGRVALRSNFCGTPALAK